MASPPEFEAKVLRNLPALLLAGTVPPAACAVLLQEPLTGILAASLIAAWWLALVPLTIGCLTVSIMKRPHRTAESYPLPSPRFDPRQARPRAL